MTLALAFNCGSRLNGVVSRAGRMRREDIGKSLVEDAQLCCQEVGSVMIMKGVGREQRGEVHDIARERLNTMVYYVPHVLGGCQAIMLNRGGCGDAETEESCQLHD